MKKLISILLSVMTVLSFAACSKGDTVTIYIPETATIYGSTDNSPYSIVEYVVEEGWEKKTSFTVSYGGNVEALGKKTMTMTYGDKCLVTLVEDLTRTEECFDEKGRVISRTTEYISGSNSLERTETTFTYDAYGRVLTQRSQSDYSNLEEPVVLDYTYTYKETQKGSESTTTYGNITETRVYDQSYRLVELYQVVNEERVSHMTYRYDASGNQISGESYVNGERVTKVVNTFKAVKVSKETADRLPQFKRDK